MRLTLRSWPVGVQQFSHTSTSRWQRIPHSSAAQKSSVRTRPVTVVMEESQGVQATPTPPPPPLSPISLLLLLVFHFLPPLPYFFFYSLSSCSKVPSQNLGLLPW